MPESDWRKKVVSTWRTSRRWARRLGTVLRKWIRWPFDHLVQLVALPLLVGLGILLGKRIQAQMAPGAPDVSLKDLVLLGLVVGLAVLAQAGHRLLHRLKKVGPVEFLDQQYERIVPELEGIEWEGELVDSIERLSLRLLWEYEKAESFVTHLEGSGLGASGLAHSEKLHNLLFKLAKIAMMRGHWARLVDRTELLLKITDGKYKTARTHFRCGLGYRKLAAEETEWAKTEKPPKAQEHLNNAKELLLKAQDHLWRAAEGNPHSYRACWDLGIVQFHLGEYPLAIESNKKAIHIFPRYAKAKYNLALCYWMNKQKKDAAAAILDIYPDDKDAQEIGKFGQSDEDLSGLRSDPRIMERLKKLESLAGEST